MYKKIILYPLVISIACHYLLMYSDRIYNHFFLVLNESEKKELSLIEKNIEKVRKLKIEDRSTGIKTQEKYSEGLDELVDKFEKEKSQLMSKASKKELSDKNKNGVSTDSLIDTQFGKFAGKNSKVINQEEDVLKKNSFSVNIISIKNHAISSPVCEDQYFGIGLTLGRYYEVVEVSKFSNVAKILNIQVGDILLGIKNSNNEFYPGNQLISLIQKNYKNEPLIVIFKQNKNVIEKTIKLDRICFEKSKDKNR